MTLPTRLSPPLAFLSAAAHASNISSPVTALRRIKSTPLVNILHSQPSADFKGRLVHEPVFSLHPLRRNKNLAFLPTLAITAQARSSHGVSMSSEAQSQSKEEALVLELWARFDTGAFASALPLFHKDAVYYDTLYPTPFIGSTAIGRHLHDMEQVFARDLRFVVDDVAASNLSAGVRWHVELAEDGTAVPFGRGASMYKLGPVPPLHDTPVGPTQHGELVILEAWDFPEPTFKVAAIVLPVLGAAVKLLRMLRRIPVAP